MVPAYSSLRNKLKEKLQQTYSRENGKKIYNDFLKRGTWSDKQEEDKLNRFEAIAEYRIDEFDFLSTILNDNEIKFSETIFDAYNKGSNDDFLIKALALIIQTKTMADYMQLVYVKYLHDNHPVNESNLRNNYFCGTFDKLCALTGLEMGCPMLFEKIEIKTCFITFSCPTIALETSSLRAL